MTQIDKILLSSADLSSLPKQVGELYKLWVDAEAQLIRTLKEMAECDQADYARMDALEAKEQSYIAFQALLVHALLNAESASLVDIFFKLRIWQLTVAPGKPNYDVHSVFELLGLQAVDELKTRIETTE